MLQLCRRVALKCAVLSRHQPLSCVFIHLFSCWAMQVDRIMAKWWAVRTHFISTVELHPWCSDSHSLRYGMLFLCSVYFFQQRIKMIWTENYKTSSCAQGQTGQTREHFELQSQRKAIQIPTVLSHTSRCLTIPIISCFFCKIQNVALHKAGTHWSLVDIDRIRTSLFQI